MIHKELYRGYNIYWNGTYNVNGDGEFATLQEARAAIDAHIANAKAEAEAKAEREAENSKLVAYVNGDTVTVETPDGALTMSRREYRTRVWDLCNQYDSDIVVRGV